MFNMPHPLRWTIFIKTVSSRLIEINSVLYGMRYGTSAPAIAKDGSKAK